MQNSRNIHSRHGKAMRPARKQGADAAVRQETPMHACDRPTASHLRLVMGLPSDPRELLPPGHAAASATASPSEHPQGRKDAR